MTKPITPVNDLAEIEKLRKARNAKAVKIKAQGKWFYYGLTSTMTNEAHGLRLPPLSKEPA